MENLFNNIAKLVPQGEAEFEPQTVGEGIWLTSTHLHAIEDALQASALEVVNARSAVEGTATIVSELTEALAQKETPITTANATIEALTAEVATLKAKTALPIAPPAPLATDDLAPKEETLATFKTKWDLELEEQRAKLK